MEISTAPRPSTEDARMDEPTRSVVAAPAATAHQAEPEQPALPFDDAADEPIPYALTARARRTVAPDRLPALRVIGRGRPAGSDEPPADDGDLDDPRDTRSARARALRRAGSSVADIAAHLDVDELIVRAWIGDVVVRRAAVPTGRQAAGSSAGGHEVSRAGGRSGAAADDDHVSFELARAAARAEVRHRLDVDAAFSAGLGLVAALADIDPHAVTVATRRVDVAAAVARWLDSHLPVDASRRRIVLRIGSEVAGDLARHRWAQATGLAAEAVSFTRWRGAPTPDAIDALLRVADPSLAATLAGWCDALLDPSSGDPADLAF